jgi:DNA-binding MarR family transcriptional regulator
MVRAMGMQKDTLGFLLADVGRLMRQAFQKNLEGEICLTLAQARALVYLSRQEGIRQVELADMLEVQPMTLARLIDQLVKHGLVERRPDPADRRAYRLYVTPDAAPHMAAIKQVAAANYKVALKGIDKAQADTLMLVLAKMRDNLSAR